jgi:L-2-hydroxyglutarate oxidase LhgO
MDQFDATIIGAGVIGLAIAAELSKRRGLDILVLEKNDSFGMETSSRNSEVIHAGIYYPPGLLKAGLCREGNRSLYEYCARKDIPHRRTGKIIVAVEKGEEEDILRLQAQARENGVDGLEIITSREVRRMEPAVECVMALHSPSTGIINSHALMRSFAAEAEAAGAVMSFRSEAVAIRKQPGGYEIAINKDYSIRSALIVNCAGLHSDRMAGLAGMDIDALGYRFKPCKGSYFSASPSPPLKTLVYPVPARRNEGLGIHATIDLGGRVRFGPDAEYVGVIDYAVDPGRRGSFFEAVRSYLPSIREDSLFPDMSGIRPKLQGPGDPYRDFVIREESANGFPGFINLIGIESPGLTSCLAIARHVAGLI